MTNRWREPITPKSYVYWYDQYKSVEQDARRWRRSAIAATVKANHLEQEVTLLRKRLQEREK